MARQSLPPLPNQSIFLSYLQVDVSSATSGARTLAEPPRVNIASAWSSATETRDPRIPGPG
jgi:hypothetical protein